MANIPFILFNTNRTLAKHVRYSWLYVLGISISCIFLISVLVIDFFLKQPSDVDYQTAFSSIAYFVVLFDGMAILLRVQTRSFIEPYQLALFPISRWKKFQFQIVLYLIDYKTLIYLSVIGCITIFFVKNSLYIAAILSVFFWLLLLMIISIWVVAIYGLAGKYLDKMGNQLQNLGAFFAVLLLGVQLFGDDIFIKLPIIKHVGNALYGLWVSNPSFVWYNLLFLLGSLALPLILFGVSRINNQY